MLTVRRFAELLASAGLPEPRVRQYLRQLQDDGLLPLAAGRRIPAVDAVGAALGLLAVAVGDTVASVSRLAAQYGDLKSAAGNTLLDDLSDALERLEKADALKAVVISRSGPYATIKFEDDTATSYRDDKYLPGMIRNEVTIDGGFLHHIASQILET